MMFLVSRRLLRRNLSAAAAVTALMLGMGGVFASVTQAQSAAAAIGTGNDVAAPGKPGRCAA